MTFCGGSYVQPSVCVCLFFNSKAGIMLHYSINILLEFSIVYKNILIHCSGGFAESLTAEKCK